VVIRLEVRIVGAEVLVVVADLLVTATAPLISQVQLPGPFKLLDALLRGLDLDEQPFGLLV
jgi:hypothetical protein